MDFMDDYEQRSMRMNLTPIIFDITHFGELCFQRDVDEWLEESGIVCYIKSTNWRPPHSSPVRIVFDSAADVLLFKLRWL